MDGDRQNCLNTKQIAIAYQLLFLKGLMLIVLPALPVPASFMVCQNLFHLFPLTYPCMHKVFRLRQIVSFWY